MTDQVEEQNVELNDDENEVTKALDAADKAAEVTDKAEMPKTKSAMINAMYSKMSKMKKDDLMAAYDAFMGDEEEMDDDDEEEMEESFVPTVEYKNDIEELIKDDETLSEEFKEKAATIFEAAVTSKVKELEFELNEKVVRRIEELEEDYSQELQNEINETVEQLVDKIDSYLNYVVETWMEDNKLAVESGLRTEIAENFMDNLKNLFVESYIEVPESKVDLVDDLVEEVSELETKLNKVIEDNMVMKENVEILTKEAIISEASRDLAETQAFKLYKLSENVEFIDEEDFKKKVNTIKDHYFSESESEYLESIIEENEQEESEELLESSSVMNKYLSALRKSN